MEPLYPDVGDALHILRVRKSDGANGKQLHDGTPKRLLGNLGFLFRSGFLGLLLREDEFLSAATSHDPTTPYISSSVASTGT